jgi:hypothetical protein
MIGGKPAARMGDQTAHGGVIITGLPTVLIGDAVYASAGGGGGAAAGGDAASATSKAASAITTAAGAQSPGATPQSSALSEAASEGVPLVEECPYAHHD